jgi:hypothetical protein
MGGCYNMLGELRNAHKIVVRKSKGKRDHVEGVVVDGTVVLKCLAGAEHDNDLPHPLKYQWEVC